jgi:hypothetical protein
VHEPRRYLGLELAGAKNQKTTIAVLEFYPKEHKVFLLDIYDRIVTKRYQSSDEALLELIQELTVELGRGTAKMGVNVPLELPPCIGCSRRTCGLSTKCADPSVKWMRDVTRRATKRREFTPYTQRPIELWVRYEVFKLLPDGHHFEIDETLGGNKAPLTARMSFLKRHLNHLRLLEVWPKLSIALLALHLGLNKRVVSRYRHLEEGFHAREEILEALSTKHGIFIYERDVRKLTHNLAAFDAFVCAYTALLSDSGRCTRIPKGFPTSSGWVQYPDLEALGF